MVQRRKGCFGMEYIDADNEQMFLGAATALIPFNAILRRDGTLEEKNWGAECRLRTKQYDIVLDFLLMMGAAIPPVNGRILSQKLKRVFQYEHNHQKLFELMEILKLICTQAHQVRGT